jgi:hypothetical protein
MMRSTPIVLASIVMAGCMAERPVSTAGPLESLTGVVIRKGWAKTGESWIAGGSEYYVLKVEGSELLSDKRTAKEGVILRPSKAIPFDHFTNFVGRTVKCLGVFAAGTAYIPPADRVGQVPSPDRNPFTGEIDHPIRGSGFQVYVIEPVESK